MGDDVPAPFPSPLPPSTDCYHNSRHGNSTDVAIGVAELTLAVKEVENQSFRTFETFLVASLLYLICSLCIMAAGALLDRRTRLAGMRPA